MIYKIKTELERICQEFKGIRYNYDNVIKIQDHLKQSIQEMVDNGDPDEPIESVIDWMKHTISLDTRVVEYKGLIIK